MTALSLGCSATSGGAAVATVGGVTGAPCSVEAYNEGCNTVAGPPVQHNRMVCTAGAAGAATWQLKVTCASTEYCTEKADPGAPGTAKKVTECTAVPVYTADTISGGNDMTGGSDTSMSTTQILACIQQKCSALWGQCAVKPACKAIADCIAKCPPLDDKCPETCMGTTDMTKIDQQFLAVMMCGQEQKCIPQDNPASCGDGKCDSGETPTSCPADCKTAAKCGNGMCDPGETNASCAADCPASSGACGDLTCTSPESSSTCPLDCDPGAKQVVGCATEMCSTQVGACAGDQACLAALNCVFKCGGPTTNCLSQCSSGLPSATASAFMTLASCVQAKCGSTGPVCGNGSCESGESTSSCPADCKTSGPVCGNGACESGETKAACPLDCDSAWGPTISCTNEMCGSQWMGCLNDGTCGAAMKCAAACNCNTTCTSSCFGNLSANGAYGAFSSCMQSTSCPDPCKTTPVCGNGTCDSGETTSSCPSDCKSPTTCGNGTCDSGETATSCPADCKASATCGDGVCAAGESSSCAKDCTNAGKSGGCTAGPSGSKGCFGCLCEQCVCSVGNSSAGTPADAYCCTTAWDSQCATECTACPTSGCAAP